MRMFGKFTMIALITAVSHGWLCFTAKAAGFCRVCVANKFASKLRYITTAGMLLLCITGCSRQTSGVYIAGNIELNNGNNVAVYWKNGEIIALSGGTGATWANSIAVSGSDVYVSGIEADGVGRIYPVYWKNGEKIALPSEAEQQAWASAVAVLGGDIHIAGRELNVNDQGIFFTAVYWKNGVKSALTEGPLSSLANCIALVNSDVYIAGNDSNGEPAGIKAVYWKKGERIVLAGNLGSAQINADVRAMTVSGSDVYFVGSEDNKVVYWKNGLLKEITDGTLISNANAIAVSQSGVYIVGQEVNDKGRTVAVYWKNGKKTVLTKTENSGMANAVALDHSDLYIAGKETGSNINSAVYWKNGNMVVLDCGKNAVTAAAVDIVVIP